MRHANLAQIIGAIGKESFAEVAAHALMRFLEFNLATVIEHHPTRGPVVMFDDFDRVNCRYGLANYLRFTHRINPMLARAPETGVFRARDFSVAAIDLADDLDAHVTLDASEELGFRTAGWPQGLEEIGLYFEAGGKLVEMSCYRERGRRPAPQSKLRELNDVVAPIAAAFDKNASLFRHWTGSVLSALTARERDVCELLLAGCSSQAIASRLHISRHTVKDHRKRIFSKLGISSLAGLFALTRRMNRPPPWRDGAAAPDAQ